MTLTRKEETALHLEAMKSCTCDISLPRSQRCTKSGWIRCNYTLTAFRKLKEERLNDGSQRKS